MYNISYQSPARPTKFKQAVPSTGSTTAKPPIAQGKQNGSLGPGAGNAQTKRKQRRNITGAQNRTIEYQSKNQNQVLTGIQIQINCRNKNRMSDTIQNDIIFDKNKKQTLQPSKQSNVDLEPLTGEKNEKQGFQTTKAGARASNQQQEILSKQYSMNTTNFGSIAGAASQKNNASPTTGNQARLDRQRHSRMNMNPYVIPQQIGGLNAGRQSKQGGYLDSRQQPRIKSGIYRLDDQFENEGSRFNKTASMYHMISGNQHRRQNLPNSRLNQRMTFSGDSGSEVFSGALSGAIDAHSRGAFAARGTKGSMPTSHFYQDAITRPMTSGKVDGGRRANFQTFNQTTGYFSKDKMPNQNDILWSNPKFGSDLHLQQDAQNPGQNLSNIYNVKQYLQNQKSQPLIGKKPNAINARGARKQIRFRDAHQLMYSSGGIFQNSSQGRNSSQSPVQAGNAHLSNLNIVPETEAANGGQPPQNAAQYSIPNAEMPEGQNIEGLIGALHEKNRGGPGQRQVELNRTSGGSQVLSAYDRRSQEVSSTEKMQQQAQAMEARQLNLKTFGSFKQLMDDNQGKAQQQAAMASQMSSGQKQNRTAYGKFDVDRHSVPKAQVANPVQRQQDRKLNLYNNRVLIDRESTRNMQRQAQTLNADQNYDVAGLTRDQMPGSQNYGKLINSQGLSASQSVRQDRIKQYMQKMEAPRPRSRIEVNMYKGSNNNAERQIREVRSGLLSEVQHISDDIGDSDMFSNNLQLSRGKLSQYNANSGHNSQSVSPKKARRGGQYSTQYYRDVNNIQDYDVINMIVEKYCDPNKEGIAIPAQISNVRRKGHGKEAEQVTAEGDAGRIKLGSVLEKASRLDNQETERKIEEKVRRNMEANLDRFDSAGITPRGNKEHQEEYTNINSVLEELDQQLAERMKHLNKIEAKQQAERLSAAVRLWLKESRLQRFVRDVIKIVRLSKIHDFHQRKQRALQWFQMEKSLRYQNSQGLALGRMPHTYDGSPAPGESLKYNADDNMFATVKEGAVGALVGPNGAIQSQGQKSQVSSKFSKKAGKKPSLIRKKGGGSPGQGASDNLSLIPQKQRSRKQRTLHVEQEFSSPQDFQMNTISINIGQRGDKGGAEIVNVVPSGKGRASPQLSARHRETPKKHEDTHNYKTLQMVKDRMRRLKGEEGKDLGAKAQSLARKATQAKARKRGPPAADAENLLQDSSSDSSQGMRRKKFRRRCCRQQRITDHTKPDWKLEFEWARNDAVIPNLQGRKPDHAHEPADDAKACDNPMVAQEQAALRKAKELRRKQFFNFLADFFDKFEAGQMKNKVGKNFKFTPEEKEQWLKKYFMKYYMEDVETPMETRELKIDGDISKQKRKCSCTIGEYDEKTGKLIPPYGLSKNQTRPPKTIKVEMPVEFTTKEMRDAQHGQSVGVKAKLDIKAHNQELNDLLSTKLNKIEQKQLKEGKEQSSPTKVNFRTSYNTPQQSGLRGSYRSSGRTSMSRISEASSPTLSAYLGGNRRGSQASQNDDLRSIASNKYLRSAQNVAGAKNARSQGKDQRKTEGQIEQRSSLARELLKNSVRFRIQRQIKQMVDKTRKQHSQESQDWNFRDAYPEFCELLAKYSDCRFYRSDSMDILNQTRIKPHINLTFNQMQPTLSFLSTKNQNSTIDYHNNTTQTTAGAINFSNVMNTSECYRCSIKQQNQLFRKAIQKRQTLDNTVRTVKPNAMNISYVEGQRQNNFEHDEKIKTQFKSQSNAMDLLNFSKDYFGRNQTSDCQAVSSQEGAAAVLRLEHGNYKRFGLSKNQMSKNNKFVTQKGPSTLAADISKAQQEQKLTPHTQRPSNRLTDQQFRASLLYSQLGLRI